MTERLLRQQARVEQGDEEEEGGPLLRQQARFEQGQEEEEGVPLLRQQGQEQAESYPRVSFYLYH